MASFSEIKAHIVFTAESHSPGGKKISEHVVLMLVGLPMQMPQNVENARLGYILGASPVGVRKHYGSTHFYT